MSATPIRLDNEDFLLYFEDLETSGADSFLGENFISSAEIKQAFEPIISFSKSLGNEIKNLNLEKAELSFSISLSMENQTPIFKILKSGAEAQFSLKFVWSNKED